MREVLDEREGVGGPEEPEFEYGDIVEIVDEAAGLPLGSRYRFVAKAEDFGLKQRPGKPPVLGPLADSSTVFVPVNAIKKVDA